ncbi:MAG TPA: hypothetical protein VFN18_02485 [Solirubrobacterales bacterium]|nr:hypothetical protein [Solirubrobacterales bacterium]
MRSFAATTALLVALLAAQARPAVAINDPLGSGTTRIVLDKRFARFLEQEGIELSAKTGAKRRGAALVLPISGGSLDPTIGRGEIENAGSLVFQNGRRRLPLRQLVVKTKRTPLIAKVGGSQLKVATAAKIDSSRQGFGTAFTAQKLRLSAKVATRLNKKLRPAVPFASGQPLGKLISRAQPQTIAILGTGAATVSIDPAFVAKLDAHFVSLNPIAPAQRAPGPVFSFPIIGGGRLSPDALSGTLRSAGALEFLQLGSGQVFWTEPWFDLGLHQTLAEADVEPAPTYPGKLGQVPVLDLGPGTTDADPNARTISLGAAALSLPAAVAAYFNQAFAEGRPDFVPGEPVGSLSFTAQAQ